MTGRRLPKWVLTVGAITVVLGALEVILRTTHLFGASLPWSEPDPVLGWRYSSGRTYWFHQENDHPITGRINRHGWRDSDWSLEKPPGRYRIAIVGDSYVEAFQVESDRTFLALMGSQLNAQLPFDVEVMNFGRSDATTTEERLILEREVSRFDPDLVALFFVPQNDIRDIAQETAFVTRRPFYVEADDGTLRLQRSLDHTPAFALRRAGHAIRRESALLSLLWERISIALALSRSGAGRPADASPQTLPRLWRHLSLMTAHPDPTYVRNYALAKRLIHEMAEWCAVRDIDYVLVCVNLQVYRPELEAVYSAQDPTFRATFFEEDLRRYADALGIGYVGLQRPFRQRYNETGMALHWGGPGAWGHWNYAGHKMVADALITEVLPRAAAAADMSEKIVRETRRDIPVWGMWPAELSRTMDLE